ncbi:hypothetical protein C0J52_20961 [Blattella germanica]|nr:hypothetical protein C0J52_20961 [Blattella germanica]
MNVTLITSYSLTLLALRSLVTFQHTRLHPSSALSRLKTRKPLHHKKIFLRMEVNVGGTVLPGDVVNISLAAEKNKIIIGPGLRVYLDQILVLTCGILRKKEPNTY